MYCKGSLTFTSHIQLGRPRLLPQRADVSLCLQESGTVLAPTILVKADGENLETVKGAP